jgi:hypothetical protein
VIKTNNLDLNVVKDAFKDYLMTQDYVKRVYTKENFEFYG